MFQGVPLIAELVKYFEENYTHQEVRSVWMIEKSRENDGFQGWHRGENKLSIYLFPPLPTKFSHAKIFPFA
jgi:hypothetical protein